MLHLVLLANIINIYNYKLVNQEEIKYIIVRQKSVNKLSDVFLRPQRKERIAYA